MSYDIYFHEPKCPTCGRAEEWYRDPTYNYARKFDFRQLDGKSGAETAELLAEAVARLGTARNWSEDDYSTNARSWEPTDGNVGWCLQEYAEIARAHPDWTWEVR